MATSVEYMEFVAQQLQGAGEVRYREMFGDYLVYVNGKPILTVCDGTVFVKQHPVLTELLNDAPVGIPYDGAKPHYIADVDNRELLLEIVRLLEPVTPLPKSRKKRTD